MIKKIATVLIIAVATVGIVNVATAQDSTAAAAQTEVRSLLQQLRQKTIELRDIHAQTLQNNADLRAQQEQFSNLLRQAIEDQGYDVEAGRERVQDMTTKIQSGELSDDERQAVMQDMAAERQSLIQARNAALQQPEVRDAGQKLQQNTLAAMKKVNPDVDQLVQDMEDLRQQLRAAAQQQQAQ